MIRDFALGRARVFSSDIDLVSDADDAQILDAIRVFSPSRNKFGGFRFRSGKWRFDIWPLSQTWAFKEGHVVGKSLDDLLATTFFNVDAAIFHLNSGTAKASIQFAAGIERRTLDVNLEENPSPDSMARRAIRMAMEYDLALSARLVEYIVAKMSSRPPWIGEMLWERLLEHSQVTDEPFHIDAQRKIPISEMHTWRQ
jgi:hypothetical protein